MLIVTLSVVCGHGKKRALVRKKGFFVETAMQCSALDAIKLEEDMQKTNPTAVHCTSEQ